MGDLVYAIGGNDGHHNQKTAERYDYKANQWSLIASMNTKRADASAAALNGNMNPVKQ
jgi:kelch-like protein 10